MPQALEHVQALALPRNCGGDDLASQPGGGHAMPREPLREVQVAIQPAPVRGAVAAAGRPGACAAASPRAARAGAGPNSWRGRRTAGGGRG
ncbi:hypothetical protein G6F60_015473 [Rhizopus arrhizus]|nr:hypothetical protein G6F60_015473 [Rhizopus arrhizus]